MARSHEPIEFNFEQAAVGSASQIVILLAEQTEVFSAGEITVVTEGLIQGRGAAVVKSIVTLRREGTSDVAAVAVAQLAASGATGANLTHGATVASGRLQLTAEFAATSTGSTLRHYIQVCGAKTRIRPND